MDALFLDGRGWMQIHVQRYLMQGPGRPKEIAGLAVLLASNAASYINGQALCADGGYSISFE